MVSSGSDSDWRVSVDTDTTQQRMKKIKHKFMVTHDTERTHQDKACLTINLNFMDKSIQNFRNKNPHICFYDYWKLEMTQGWANDDRFYMFGWTFYITQSLLFEKWKQSRLKWSGVYDTHEGIFQSSVRFSTCYRFQTITTQKPMSK